MLSVTNHIICISNSYTSAFPVIQIEIGKSTTYLNGSTLISKTSHSGIKRIGSKAPDKNKFTRSKVKNMPHILVVIKLISPTR